VRRNIVRILGLSLAAVALITYINWNGKRDATGFDPAGHLHCGGAQIAGARATAAPSEKETRSPAELAAAWAKARSPELLAGQHELYKADERVDIGFDRKAQTVAVLTFRADEHLGWHLEAVVACQGATTKTP